jgi:hypothetical protein
MFHQLNYVKLLHSLALALLFPVILEAEDWPQFRGPNRDSIWNETGILQTFPSSGLIIRWREPIGAGNSSPVVARGRVYVTDSETEKPAAWERVHCFDERTGKPIWTYRDAVEYPDAFDPKNPSGPCPTPVVDSRRVYTLGATSHLLCLDARKGSVIWKKNSYADLRVGAVSESHVLPVDRRRSPHPRYLRQAGRLRRRFRQAQRERSMAGSQRPATRFQFANRYQCWREETVDRVDT